MLWHCTWLLARLGLLICGLPRCAALGRVGYDSVDGNALMAVTVTWDQSQSAWDQPQSHGISHSRHGIGHSHMGSVSHSHMGSGRWPDAPYNAPPLPPHGLPTHQACVSVLPTRQELHALCEVGWAEPLVACACQQLQVRVRQRWGEGCGSMGCARQRWGERCGSMGCARQRWGEGCGSRGGARWC